MVSIVNRLFVSCLLSHYLVQCMIVLWILCQFLEFIQFLIQDFIVFNVFVSTEIGKLCFVLFVLHSTFCLGNRQNKSFVCTVLLLTLYTNNNQALDPKISSQLWILEVCYTRILFCHSTLSYPKASLRHLLNWHTILLVPLMSCLHLNFFTL